TPPPPPRPPLFPYTTLFRFTHLTGIDDATVRDAPALEWALPAFLEFARGCVFVAHNARFDFTFLNASLVRLDYEPFPPPPVCTRSEEHTSELQSRVDLVCRL